MSRKFSQKSQKTKIIKAKLKKMITLVVDFHSSTTYLQSQKFLALETTLKYFFKVSEKYCRAPVDTTFDANIMNISTFISSEVLTTSTL